jgi:hypothetical protein
MFKIRSKEDRMARSSRKTKKHRLSRKHERTKTPAFAKASARQPKKKALYDFHPELRRRGTTLTVSTAGFCFEHSKI